MPRKGRGQDVFCLQQVIRIHTEPLRRKQGFNRHFMHDRHASTVYPMSDSPFLYTSRSLVLPSILTHESDPLLSAVPPNLVVRSDPEPFVPPVIHKGSCLRLVLGNKHVVCRMICQDKSYPTDIVLSVRVYIRKSHPGADSCRSLATQDMGYSHR